MLIAYSLCQYKSNLNVNNNVTFGYKPDRKVLDNISFVVSPGETVALVGPSGSGKTTIVRLLFRLYETTGGTITFNGRDIRHIRLKSLRGRIGIVPQDTVLFNETIRYNILRAKNVFSVFNFIYWTYYLSSYSSSTALQEAA
ncbi:ABC transporter domain-containing protein [Ditylenchus destructor]|uniref:ABC transporter domain-containing protein n=1 Tax=Ditylenchus destructor TaxID=166010 RepID=A0AAD4NGW9_9BILA|nr:ABC transporter domain-containing protein [Ditylenchus destructor]